MANIEKELKAIMEAEYGEEVRTSIHRALKAGNDEITEYGLKEAERSSAEAERIAAEKLREEVNEEAKAAAEEAREAAKKANAVAEGGVSKMIVSFEEPEEPELPASGEAIGTFFGKVTGWIRKFRAELSDNVLLRAYPVGAIYMSVNNADPGALFGGTWEAWGSGRVPVGVNGSDADFNAVEKTGGKAAHVHTSPQHVHGVDAHSHTMSHTHTINAHSHTMGHTHGINSHVHSGPLHSHTFDGYAKLDISGGAIMLERTAGQTQWVARDIQVNSGLTHSTPNVNGNHSNTVVVGTIGHGGNGNTGGATLTTNNSNTANTGGSGVLTSNGSSSANTGGTALATNNNAAANTGSASSLPPYITCYMWKRIA